MAVAEGAVAGGGLEVAVVAAAVVAVGGHRIAKAAVHVALCSYAVTPQALQLSLAASFWLMPALEQVVAATATAAAAAAAVVVQAVP